MTLAPRDFPLAHGELDRQVRVVDGAAAMASATPAAARLTNVERDGGITGSWRWIQASLDEVSPHRRPWVVSVGARDELAAVAVLVDDTEGSVRRTRLAGSEERHRGCLTARDDEAAVQLGAALA